MSFPERHLYPKALAALLASLLPCAVASAAWEREPEPEAHELLTAPAADAEVPPGMTPGTIVVSSGERSILGWLQGLTGSRGFRGSTVERRTTAPGRDPVRALALEQRPPGLALLCESSNGGSLGFVRQCLLARLEVEPLALPGYGQGVGLSSHWNLGSASLDLSFGLGWLDPRQPQRVPGGSSIALEQPGLMDFGALGLNLPTSRTAAFSVQLEGSMSIGTDGWLSLGVQQLRGRNESVNLWGQMVPVFESDSLRVAAGFGDFSGALTSRVIELQGRPGSVNSLDLGLSWRTPWRGALSVGATQYWNRGDVGQWPLRELPSAVDEAGGRVPYVRYHQDL
ncbi:MAG: hypothetical protein MEQ07_02570 [Aquimonas sp.]|nr:hypothetical protein [Aquimonas sp.]